MKQIIFLPLLLITCFSFSQSFPGYRSSNHTGVNSVFFNPAHIAGGKKKVDINIFSIHTFVGNNQADFSLGELGKAFNGDSLTRKLFSAENGPTSGLVDVVINGPSIMLALNNKTALALTTRARTLANIIDLDGRLAEQLIDDLNASTTLPYTIASGNNQRITVNAWTEIGASLARVLMNKGKHYVKGGLTLKYIGGIGNGYTNIDALNGTIEDDLLGDVYLSNTTGRIQTGFGGIDIANIEATDFFNFKNSGFGADLGFVYEFRPAGEQYKFKAGLAVLDLGSIRYDKNNETSGSYELNITGSERFYFNELDGKEIDEYNDVFMANPQYFTPIADGDQKYSVSLPTTLQLDLDYHLKNHFFAGFSAQLPIVSDKIYNGRYYSSFTLTPRYDGKKFGVFLPINYNSLTSMNVGVSFRLGPIFIGSGSVITALLGTSKQADAHFGARFGIGKN